MFEEKNSLPAGFLHRRSVRSHSSASTPSEDATKRLLSSEPSARLASLSLIADDSYKNAPPVRGAAMLEQENTLPCPKLKPAIHNRDHLARSCEGCPNVRGRSFRSMSKVIAVFRD